MNKQLQEFINDDKNSIKQEFIISKEVMPNGYYHVYVKSDDLQQCLFEFYFNPKTWSKKDAPPKHTGGKKPYVMLMIEKLSDIVGENSDIAIASAIRLISNIQWNTGLLCDKKKKPMTFEMLREFFKCSKGNMSKRINAMEHYKILNKTKEGYVVSPDFIKKGGTNP